MHWLAYADVQVLLAVDSSGVSARRLCVQVGTSQCDSDI